MAIRTTNRDAGSFVQIRQAFKASNLSGAWTNDGWYVVKSYGWYPIFAYEKASSLWFEEKDGYSRSTKRQMSNCRRELNGTVKPILCDLKEVLRAVKSRRNAA